MALLKLNHGPVGWLYETYLLPFEQQKEKLSQWKKRILSHPDYEIALPFQNLFLFKTINSNYTNIINVRIKIDR